MPIHAVVDRLERIPGALARTIAGTSSAVLATRPGPGSWSPTEIVCHLRDVEEPPILAFGATVDDLATWKIGAPIGHPLDPDRWAVERQYVRNDPHEALAALRRRRREVVTLLSALTPAEWQRGGIHPSHGRRTLLDWVGRLAAHDDNHLDQLRRAVEGRA